MNASPMTCGISAQGHAVETVIIELRELAVAIANNLVTGFPPPQLAAAIDALTGANGLIAVTPVAAMRTGFRWKPQVSWEPTASRSTRVRPGCPPGCSGSGARRGSRAGPEVVCRPGSLPVRSAVGPR
ncbi:hypothetical protein M2271_007589 [Streptomyces sp. LBL]|nr:hypothetical protein [Streptomyces sp. LBL]